MNNEHLVLQELEATREILRERRTVTMQETIFENLIRGVVLNDPEAVEAWNQLRVNSYVRVMRAPQSPPMSGQISDTVLWELPIWSEELDTKAEADDLIERFHEFVAYESWIPGMNIAEQSLGAISQMLFSEDTVERAKSRESLYWRSFFQRYDLGAMLENKTDTPVGTPKAGYDLDEVQFDD